MGNGKKCDVTCGHSLFALMVLLIGVLWLLNSTGTIALNIPWGPTIVIILAVGMMAKYCRK